MTDKVAALLRKEYDARQRVSWLRQQAFGGDNTEADLGDLVATERALADVRERRHALEAGQAGAGRVLDTTGPNSLLGPESTGLEAVVKLRMSHVPTAICHLLDAESHPLVSCSVKQVASNRVRRIRVTCRVEGYSAPAVDTIELVDRKERGFTLLPTFFPVELATVTELTSATVSALVEDLDSEKVEVHRTSRIWLLARTTAPLSVRDPSTGKQIDLTPYLGAFVTPNAPDVIGFLRTVADKHSERRLLGYQGSSDVVEPQVQAVYEALKAAAITYVDSVVGWETWPQSGVWHYLETVMIGSHGYDAARQRGDRLARTYEQRSQDPSMFRRWALRDLRAGRGITPMEWCRSTIRLNGLWPWSRSPSPTTDCRD